MNDLFGIAPNAYTSARELRLLMNTFGPQSSRFVLTAPQYQDWYKNILSEFDKSGDIERERIKTVLTRAKLNHALIDKKNLPWIGTDTWVQNAIKVWKSGGDFKKIYISDEDHDKIVATKDADVLSVVISASEPETFSATDEEIDTSPDSYWRTSRILCSMSRDVHIIDPYLNPTKRDYADVFVRYLQEFGKIQKIMSVNFWVREQSVSKYNDETIIAAIKNLINSTLSNIQRPLSIYFYLLLDETAKDKLHARYLLTDCGAVKYDQGFQKLPSGRINIVSPVGTDLHDSLYKKFSQKNFDFKISSTICLKFCS